MHYRELIHGGSLERAADFREQAEFGTCVYPKARLAPQLAHLHQRNRLVLPRKPRHLREQYGYPAAAFGGSV